MDYSRETATCSKLTLLWSRHELTVSLSAATYAEANVSEVIQGRSLLWVLPRMIDTRSLRLHCRQCNISKLTVNGKKATWQMLDPLERIVCDDKLACDGEAHAVFKRAAMMAAHDGELLVELPQQVGKMTLPDEVWKSDARCTNSASSGIKARKDAFSNMRKRTSSAKVQPYLIEVDFTISKPMGGLRMIFPPDTASIGLEETHKYNPVLFTTGGLLGSLYSGEDVDGARCRWPCLDGPYGHHEAPVELLLTNEAHHSVVASGYLISKTVIDNDEIKSPNLRGDQTCTHWFVGPRVRSRSVGFAIGGFRQLESHGDSDSSRDTDLSYSTKRDNCISQWVLSSSSPDQVSRVEVMFMKSLFAAN